MVAAMTSAGCPRPADRSAWPALLSTILEPLGERVHIVDPANSGRVRQPGNTPVVVAGDDVPEWLLAAGHGPPILAPDPRGPAPRFSAPPATILPRVLAFSPVCHVAAQRAKLRSALFQPWVDPSVAGDFRRWQLDQERLRGYVFSSEATSRRWRFAHDVPPDLAPSRQRCRDPIVSVVTIVRNAAADLRHTLPHVLSQSMDAFEVIVLDGGSTDDTVEVIRRFESQIDHWESGTDGGPFHAMQKAATVARGRWILFMNAGDRFVDADALGRLYDAARDDADFVAGHHVYIDSNGIESLNYCVDFEQTYARLLAGDLDSAWVQGAPCHQAVLTRTELLRRHGFDLSYRIAADHEFMYRMRRHGASFQVVPTVVAEYVGGGLSSRQQLHCLEEWRRMARAYSRDVCRADRSIDRLVTMALRSIRRQGPFDFSQASIRRHLLRASLIDLRYRLKHSIIPSRGPRRSSR